jgi:hypothetical protein
MFSAGDMRSPFERIDANASSAVYVRGWDADVNRSRRHRRRHIVEVEKVSRGLGRKSSKAAETASRTPGRRVKTPFNRFVAFFGQKSC